MLTYTNGQKVTISPYSSCLCYVTVLILLVLHQAASVVPANSYDEWKLLNQGPNTDNSPTGTSGGDPIILATGMVQETFVDAEVPGITLPWYHKRSYTSRGNTGTFIQGYGWKAGLLDSFMRESAPGEVDLHWVPWNKTNVDDAVDEPDEDGMLEVTGYELWYVIYNPLGDSGGVSDKDQTIDVMLNEAISQVYEDPDSVPEGWCGTGVSVADGQDHADADLPRQLNCYEASGSGYFIINDAMANQIIANLYNDDGKKVGKLSESGPLGYYAECVDWFRVPKYTRVSFKDINPAIADGQQGTMKALTNRYGTEEIGFEFADDTGLRIVTAQTSQGWMVSYLHDTEGNLTQIDVKNGDSQVIKRIKYTYYVSGMGYSSDCGTDGDLIMVRVYDRATGDNLTSSLDSSLSIKKTMMYRYYTGAEGEEGFAHQMKMIIPEDMVEKALSDGSLTATQMLALDDDNTDRTGQEIVSSPTARYVKDYANKTFTYYTSDFDTSDVDGDEGGVGGDDEDLETKYGASGFDETGYVKTQVVRRDYSGEMSARTFFYMENASASDVNDVWRVTVEDRAVDGTNNTGTRKIWGLNPDRLWLRKISVDDPQATTPKYWCESVLRGTERMTDTNATAQNHNSVVQRRSPSAHTCVDTLTEIRTFLDPSTSNNDLTTINACEGQIRMYEYNLQGNIAYEGVAKGRDGLDQTSVSSFTWVSGTVYGDGTANKPTYLPVQKFAYPEPTKDKTDASRLVTTYSYTFHDDPIVAQQLATTTVTHAAVSESNNGSGSSAVTKQYRDDRGRVRWSMDADGVVTYMSYHPDTGGMVYTLRDADTSNLPTEVTTGTDDRLAWVNPLTLDDGDSTNDHDCPTGFDSTGGDIQQLVSTARFDSLGRAISTTGPSGTTNCMTYGQGEIRTYKNWDKSSGTTSEPISVHCFNDGGLSTEIYSLDPSGVTIGTSTSGSDYWPTGIDTGVAPEDDYISLRRYSYNADTSLLEFVDSYHEIPAAGNETMGSHFYRTAYLYDEIGRRTHTITAASGTSASNAVEQVVEHQYDALDRVVKVLQGVSDANHNLGSDYSGLSTVTMKTVASAEYDDNGVGDGLTTTVYRYYDASDNTTSKAVKLVGHYDWRGRLRGIEPETAPYLVADVDNYGRYTAMAEFVGTTPPTWATVLADDDYAENASDTNRRTLSTQRFDERGCMFRSAKHSVSSSGVVGDAVVVDRFFDSHRRLVALSGQGVGATELAYDNLGNLIQRRSVTSLKGSEASVDYYTSGSFNYRAPAPVVDLDDLSGGDDEVLVLTHFEYDVMGKPITAVRMEANHDDTASVGLDATADDDYVQSSAFAWYDSGSRLIALANYGSGDIATGAGQWKYAAVPTRPVSAPTASSDTCLLTQYAYSQGRLDTVTDPKGIDASYVYDALGRTVKVIEDDGGSDERITLTQYDGLSNTTRLIADVDADSGSISNGSWAVDTDDQITKYFFEDAYNLRLPTVVEYPDSADSTWDVVTLTWSLDGQLATRTAQKAASGDTATVLSFDYDADTRQMTGQRVTTAGTGIDTSIQSIAYSHDDLGRVEIITSYANNNYTSLANQMKYWFDDFGQVVREYQGAVQAIDDDGEDNDDSVYVGYTYDTADADSDGIYDNARRLAYITYPNGRKVHMTYGSSGSISDLISRIGAIADDNGSGSAGAVLASYAFTGGGRLVQEDFEGPDIRLDLFSDLSGSSTSGTYAGFDRFGRVAQQVWREYTAGVNRDVFFHGYDYNSNRTTRDLSLTTGLDEKYAYDNLNRLTSTDRGTLSAGTIGSKTHAEQWSLSPTGNWDTYKLDADGDGSFASANDLDQSRSHNAANEIADPTDAITESAGQAVWVDPTYDAAGNMTEIPTPVDPTKAYACTYDAWNRLVKVTDNSATPKTIAEYEYDGLHRRIRKSFDTSAPAAPDGVLDTHRFSLYAGWQLVETRMTTGTAGDYVQSVRPERQYVWSARYIDAPICRDENLNGDWDCTDSPGDRRLYYLTDANMNVTALADTTGQVVERYSYDSYGRRTVLNGSADADAAVLDWSVDADNTSDYDNPIGFAGYYRDAETGLYHVRFRMYHAQVGRWLQRDPLGYVDGMSLYEYCASLPVGYVDPWGLQAVPLPVGTPSPTLIYHGAPAAGIVPKLLSNPYGWAVVIGGGLAVGIHVAQPGPSYFTVKKQIGEEQEIFEQHRRRWENRPKPNPAPSPEPTPTPMDDAIPSPEPEPGDQGEGAEPAPQTDKPNGTIPGGTGPSDDDKEKPDLGKPGTRRNPDGTPKNPADQLEQIEKAQRRNRRAVESTKKSRQNLRRWLDDFENWDDVWY